MTAAAMNEVLDETEVAAILDCQPTTVQEKARNGELPAIKYGRSWRFPRAALLDALNRQALANAQPKPRPEPEGVLLPPPARRKAPNLPALP